MSIRTTVLLFLGLITILRLIIAAHGTLAPDEAYYFLWSQHLDWSYYSKGPAVAVTMWLSSQLLGETELGIRFFSPLLALGTSVLIFFLTRRLYGEVAGIWAVLLLNATPIFNAGGVLMTIDPLSIFFWTAALASLWQARIKADSYASWWWLLTGLLVGLGFLAKYTNAIFLLSALLFLLLHPADRVAFRRPGFYLMLLAFGICTIPVLIWNSANQWITVSHLQARGRLDEAFSLNFTELAEFVALHFGVYSPLICLGIGAAVVLAWPQLRRSPKVLYLLLFGLPLIIMYGLLSLKETGEANWTAPAFVSLGILAAGVWTSWVRRGASWAGVYATVAILLGFVMSALLLNTDIARMAGVSWSYQHDPSGRLRGWQTIAREVQEVREQVESDLGDEVFLIGNNYGMAAALSFYLPERRVEGPGHPPVYIPESQNIENQFSFWPRYDEFLLDGQPVVQDEYFTEQQGSNPFMNRTALYITDEIDRQAPPASIREGFEDYERIALIEITRRGHNVRTVLIFACYNYLTKPL